MNNYDDIINMKRPISMKYSKMSIDDRSAQFASFAALSGHSEAIIEKARLTDNKIELSEDLQFFLDITLQEIISNISNKPKVSITYFIKDEKKQGGKYETTINFVSKIDMVHQIIYLNDIKINIKDILHIELI